MLWRWTSILIQTDVFSKILKKTKQTKHYENTPIQIYWKFHHQKLKVLDINFDIFLISAQNIDCGTR